MFVNARTESRSIAYSADMAGRAGRIACHVVRADATGDGRATFSIAVRNDTASDAQVSAFAPDPLESEHRRIVQSIVGPYADFSTTVEIDLERYGGIPPFHVEASGDDIAFSLIVPGTLAMHSTAALAKRGTAIETRPASSGSTLATLASDLPLLRTSTPHNGARSDAYGARSPRRPLRVSTAPAQRSPAIVPTLLIFVAIVAAATIGTLWPRVRDLAIPIVTSDPNVTIGYHATGLGSVTYRILDPEAQLVASGNLATGAGTFPITLPKNRAARAYLVRVAIEGALGTAVAEAYLKQPGVAMPVIRAVVAPKPVVPPEIRSLALDRSTLHGGDTLNVFYDVTATSGSVALVDAASQTVYGKLDLSPSGRSSFVIPAFDNERFLSVVVTAHRGQSTTHSRIAITAAPQASPTPLPDTLTNGSQPADAPAVTVPTIVAPTAVRSAASIQLRIHDAVRGLLLILTDSDGTELARKELTTDAMDQIATFTAPTVMVRAHVRVQITYPQGSGSETIVKSIEVLPH